MMSHAEMSPIIGKPAQIDVGDMTFLVTIKDVRIVWGKAQYLVTPQSGHGETWKNADSVRVNGA